MKQVFGKKANKSWYLIRGLQSMWVINRDAHFCLFFFFLFALSSLQCFCYGYTNTVEFLCEYPTKEPTVAVGGVSPNHSPEQCVISYGKGGLEEADSGWLPAWSQNAVMCELNHLNKHFQQFLMYRWWESDRQELWRGFKQPNDHLKRKLIPETH